MKMSASLRGAFLKRFLASVFSSVDEGAFMSLRNPIRHALN
jgi:hypothetical protein